MTRAAPGKWKVRWRITNTGDPLHLTAITAPHLRFRSPDHHIDVGLPRGGTFEPQLEIASSEAAGQVIETTFLMINAEAGATSWRILARMRVRVDDDGVPHPAIERIDVQEVGFSGTG